MTRGAKKTLIEADLSHYLSQDELLHQRNNAGLHRFREERGEESMKKKQKKKKGKDKATKKSQKRRR